MDILDNEASEDEAARKNASLNRLPSYEANVELVEKEKRYRQILTQAAVADESVRQKWDQWENGITELTWSEVGTHMIVCVLLTLKNLQQEDLEASVPSSTISPTSQKTAQGTQTQSHAQRLRGLIETLDDLHSMQDDIVQRARRRAEVDDITNRILNVSAGLERLAEVQPAMFEDISDEELAKYDKYLQDMSDIEQRQTALLEDIKVILT